MHTQAREDEIRAVLSKENLHGALIDCLLAFGMTPEQWKWPNERLIEHLRETSKGFGIREDELVGLVSGGLRKALAGTRLVSVVMGRHEVSDAIVMASDTTADAAVAELQQRFLPTVLPVLDTPGRRKRLERSAQASILKGQPAG